MTDARDLSRRASELAASHPPAVVLENLFLGFFAVLGWIVGRLWFYGSKTVYIVALALADGYVKGARAANAPVQQLPQAADTRPLVEDDRITDHTTPFGIPFGPNVQASHD